jgi:cytoskeletal protein RodZ
MGRKTSSKRKTRRLSKKLMLLVVFGILAAACLVYFVLLRQSENKTITTADGKKVTLSPATPSEKQASDAAKDAIVKRDEQTNNTPPPSPSGLKQVSVAISEATATNVKAYVTGVFEDDGVCTATATKGAQTITKSSTGFRNASYTQCAPITWDAPLSNGAWAVKIAYKSVTAQGEQSKIVEVQ